MKPFWIGAAGLGVLGAVSAALMINATTPQAEQVPAEGAAIVSITLPDELTALAALGETMFETKCAACHGPNAVGRQGMAPPLVHKIYEPSHHGDESFQRAVAQGVRAHHWRFGDMPPIDGLTRGDVKSIVAYIRSLQRANGI